jgi:prepilin-type N-terminal cleavage/methylation domain-containing protein
VIAVKKQRGVTLIELLIGLLLSSIAIAGMLLTFRSTLQVTARANPAAIADGERIAALLRTHLLLQKAGYGVDTSDIDTLVLGMDDLSWDGSGLQSGSTGLGSSLIWSSDSNLDGVVECEGIVPSTGGGLVFVRADCANAATWQSAQNWVGVDLVAPPSPEMPEAALAVTMDGSACSPVGVGDPAADVLQGVTATVDITLSTGVVVSSSTCLYNFSPAAS